MLRSATKKTTTIAVLTLVIGSALLSVNAYAKTVMRVTLQLPETHSLGQNWNAFKDIVEAKSEGEIEVQIFPSAQLYKDKQVPEAVGSGAVEAGSASLTRFAGSVPAVDVIYVPFLLDTEAKLRAATSPDSTIRKTLDAKILEETGARVLWWQAFGRNVYLSNGSAIKTPSDLKGKKVRTYGKLLGWTVEALGGAPTLMSGSKQFLAYQQGAVDVGMTGVSGVSSRKLYEVMDHVTLAYDSDIEFVAVVNNDFFTSLSESQKTIVMDAARVVEQQLRDAIFTQEAENVELLRKKMTVVELTDEDRALWREATKNVVKQFLEVGGDTAKQVIDAANKL